MTIPVRFKPTLLGVAFCYAALLVLVQNSSPLVSFLGTNDAFVFVQVVLVSALLSSLIFGFTNAAVFCTRVCTMVFAKAFARVGTADVSERFFGRFMQKQKSFLNVAVAICILGSIFISCFLIWNNPVLDNADNLAEATETAGAVSAGNVAEATEAVGAVSAGNVAEATEVAGVVNMNDATEATDILNAVNVPYGNQSGTQYASVVAYFLVLGAMFGLTLSLLFLAWGNIFAKEMPEDILIHAALALPISSALYICAGLPLLREAPFLYASVLMIVAVLMIDSGMTGNVHAGTDGVLGGAGIAIVKNAIVKNWKPILSASISAFIIGLVWNPLAASASSSSISLQGLPHLFVAPIAATLVVIGAFIFRPRTFSLHILNDVVMPVAIAILLVVPLIEIEGVDIAAQVGILSQVCFALVVIATFSSLSAGTRTTSAPSQIIFAISFMLFAVSMLLGMYCIHWIGTGGRILCLILLTLFLVLMVIQFALHNVKQSSYREQLKEVLNSYLQRRCEQLALENGLSAREREVFLYLARGYGHVYIAKELYVSENTVRTHVRHIYTKLDVGSREELLRLVDLEKEG